MALQLETLFLEESECIFQMALKSLERLEEKAYAWMDECLSDARRAMCQ